MNERAKVCVITGGTSGIGLAAAERFAGEGYRVGICGRDETRLDTARVQITEAGHSDIQVETMRADLHHPSESINFIDRMIESLGHIDVLVNNAAEAPLSLLDEMSDEAFESVTNLNIGGVFYVTRSAWRSMKEQGGGIVVNVSSLAAVDPFPGLGLYGATKAWVELFTKALASEGKPLGIRAYGVRPGAVETPLLRGLFPDFPAEQTVSPAEVAEAIWSVCQAAFANSSGQVVSVSRQ